MNAKPLVVGVPGSLREGSYTKAAIAHALAAAEDAGATTELLDPREYDIPMYHPDKDDADQGDVVQLKQRIREADGVLLGSPVYHGSYSSTFRTIHDYCGFDEFEDTTVGLLVVAGGGTIASTLDHMRSTVRGVHGWVVPHQVGIRSARNKLERVDEPLGYLDDGTPIDHEFVAGHEKLRERTAKLGTEIVENLRTRPVPSGADCSTADVDADD